MKVEQIVLCAASLLMFHTMALTSPSAAQNATQGEPVVQQPTAEQTQKGSEVVEVGPGDGRFPGLEGNIKIMVDNKTGQLQIIGSDADTKIVTEQIDRIQETTKTENRLPDRILLRYSESAEIAGPIKSLYDQEYAAKNGNAEIIPLTSPNALLVFGNGVANVEEISNLALLRGMAGKPGAGLKDKAYLEYVIFLASKRKYVAVVTTTLSDLPQEAVDELK